MRIFASVLLLALLGAAFAQNDCLPLSKALVTIRNLEDYNKVKACTSLQGLRIADALPDSTGTPLNSTVLSFPALTSIVADGGNSGLSISTFATGVSMPLLTSLAGAVLTVSNSPNLATLTIGGAASIPVLPTSIVTFTNLPALTSLSVSISGANKLDITTVGSAVTPGNFTLTNLATIITGTVTNCQLNALNLPKLASATSMSIKSNAIANYNFPNEFSSSLFEVSSNTQIKSAVFNLKSIGTSGSTTSFLKLTSNSGTNYGFDLPKLNVVYGGVTVTENTGMTFFNTGFQFECTSFALQNNQQLKTANVYYIQTTAGVSVENNGDGTGDVSLGFGKVGTDLSVSQNNFKNLFFPQLTRVFGNVAITGNTISAEGVLQAKTFFNVSGSVSVLSNSVGRLDLSGLQGVAKSMKVQSNTRPDLQNANAFNLTQLQYVIGGLLIDSNSFMNSIDVPNLSYVGGADGIKFTLSNDTSFIVTLNSELKTFTGSSSNWIVTGNFTFSDNVAATSVVVDGLVQVGGLDIQRNAQLGSFSANGLVCSVVVVFNGMPKLRTITLNKLASVDNSVFVTQGSTTATADTCAVTINDTVSKVCTASTPAPCFDCLDTTLSYAYCSQDGRVSTYQKLCGARSNGVTCPAAKLVNIILTGGASTFTVVQGGSGSSSSSSSSGPQNSDGNPTTPGGTTSSATTQAIAVAMIVALVSSAL